MATHTNLEDDDDFGGDFSGGTGARRSGNKRSFGDLGDDEDDIFGSKKANVKVEETAPGAATGMILSLRESLQTCEEALATCQAELDAAKAEIQKWHTSFQNEPFINAGTTPEPKSVLVHLQSLKFSEESLKEQLEKAKKKEAAFIVTFAKREQEIAELKSAVRDLRMQLKPPSLQSRRLLLDPAIHEEFTRLKSLVEEKDKRIKELQDNVNAVNFTPQSKMGKMLMAKCRTLMEENEEIGNQANEGKVLFCTQYSSLACLLETIHELGMKLSLQKTQNAELRSHFEGLSKHMAGLINDVEKANEMVLVLQDSLEDKDDEIRRLKDELNKKNITEEDETGRPADNKFGDEEMLAIEAQTENQ